MSHVSRLTETALAKTKMDKDWIEGYVASLEQIDGDFRTTVEWLNLDWYNRKAVARELAVTDEEFDTYLRIVKAIYNGRNKVDPSEFQEVSAVYLKMEKEKAQEKARREAIKA
jgi:hypothetical protein